MERIEMSQEERDKLEWLKRAKDGVITQREAADKMGVSDRWVRKLLQRMKKRGDAAVLHGLRSRPSNRKIATDTQRRAIEVLKQPDWHDFGPTFAAEQLAKRHRIRVGKETLRGWMIEAQPSGLFAVFSAFPETPARPNRVKPNRQSTGRNRRGIALPIWWSR
jgi:predicted DNA-binding protein (UPF0251 family)